MLKVNSRIISGTKVLINGSTGKEWYVVKETTDTHIILKNNYGGSWQMGHIIKFSNKK